jgi:hypothetical protein
MAAGREQETKLKLVAVNGNQLASQVSSVKSVSQMLDAPTLFEEKLKLYPQASSRVLKAEDLRHPSAPYNTVDSLKQNLNTLNQLQSRLRFMLRELEDLIQD